MANQALPQKSRRMLDHLNRCQNLGLILDKYAPWSDDGRGGWDLKVRSTIRRRGQNEVQTLSGGEAKGIWLNTTRKAIKDETPSLFEVSRTDETLMRARQERWVTMVKASEGVAFMLTTAARLAVGLGAAHVLETALTLDRNTGVPYLPGSSVKGIARAWGLIEVASQFDIALTDMFTDGKTSKPVLNKLADVLLSEPDETLRQTLEKFLSVTDDAITYVSWFRYIFGWQGEAGAICFLDAIYAQDNAPRYITDVMTPHYVEYYTGQGKKVAPREDDNPNPVSFITVDANQTFMFGLVPHIKSDRLAIAMDTAVDWLVRGLSQLGAGSKTAAGYGYFSPRSFKKVTE